MVHVVTSRTRAIARPLAYPPPIFRSAITRGLKFAVVHSPTYAGGTSWRDLVGKSTATTTNSVRVTHPRWGIGRNMTASQDMNWTSVPAFGVDGPITMLTVSRPNQNGVIFHAGNNTDAWNGWYLSLAAGIYKFTTGGNASFAQATSSIANTAGVPDVLVGVSRSSAHRAVWINGILGATNTTTDANAIAPNNITVGSTANSSHDNFCHGDHYLALMWARALTDSEVISISRNPWQVFARRKRTFVSSAAAGGATVAVNTEAISVSGGTISVLDGRLVSVNTEAISLTGGTLAVLAGQLLAVNAGAVEFTDGTINVTTGTMVTVNVTPDVLTFTDGTMSVLAGALIQVSTEAISFTDGVITIDNGTVIEATATKGGPSRSMRMMLEVERRQLEALIRDDDELLVLIQAVKRFRRNIQ